MSAAEKTLKEKMAELLKAIEATSKHSEKMERAAKLAERYSDIEPEPYVLPWDALAGIGGGNAKEDAEKEKTPAAWWQTTGI